VADGGISGGRRACRLSTSCLGMKTVSEFFGIPETVFDFFRSESSVSVFLGIGIGHRNFRSESVSESVQLFTDRFLRLPFWIGIYRIQNSEFTETHGPAQFLKFKFTTHGRPIGVSSPAGHHNRRPPQSTSSFPSPSPRHSPTPAQQALQPTGHCRTASPTHCTCHVACTRRT
jgi:hypothetical protein